MSTNATAYTVSLSLALLGFLLALLAPIIDNILPRPKSLESAAGAPGSRAVRLSGLPWSGELVTDDSVITWAVSPERDSYIRRRRRGYLAAVGGFLAMFAGAFLIFSFRLAHAGRSTDMSRTVGVAFIALGLGLVCYSTVPYLAAWSAFRQRRQALASARVDKALAKACEGTAPLQLADLFQLNRRQLDEYQLITRKQQRSAFFWAQVASGVAFLVLVAGIIIAMSAHSDIAKYISGGLSGLGSVLSTFLAATFFKSARDANSQMYRYYLEPQRTGRLLAAERVIARVKNTRDANLLSEMVSTVLSWEMPPDHDNESKSDEAKQEQTPGKKP
jgi:hypothetical protein